MGEDHVLPAVDAPPGHPLQGVRMNEKVIMCGTHVWDHTFSMKRRELNY